MFTVEIPSQDFTGTVDEARRLLPAGEYDARCYALNGEWLGTVVVTGPTFAHFVPSEQLSAR